MEPKSGGREWERDAQFCWAFVEFNGRRGGRWHGGGHRRFVSPQIHYSIVYRKSEKDSTRNQIEIE